MRCHLFPAALLLVGFTVVEARANPIPVPAPRDNTIVMGAREAEIVVEIDENSKEARLLVPVKFLVGPRKRLGADAGQVPTLIAGLALTCAFVSGGFWLVRRGRGRTLAALLLGLSVLT